MLMSVHMMEIQSSMRAGNVSVIGWNEVTNVSDIMKSSVNVKLSKQWLVFPLNEILKTLRTTTIKENVNEYTVLSIRSIWNELGKLSVRLTKIHNDGKAH